MEETARTVIASCLLAKRPSDRVNQLLLLKLIDLIKATAAEFC